ncbi:hypothetical protein CO083_04750 [Candidatus Roizmanbacteria bacterium CG_4_9_14_0_8_um_filter_34_12]|uniref:Glycosyltransferase 2-like domain-containing protein n=5 Tax=Candidatus Roizmaniibacteriota TaxID=1752723 RepID=A0A2M7E3Q6_9BACT|nr:MAG: hypothetical protein COW96_05010 [Candidatus Roizmanbacteria bacterium CG22_combo_CG10-13_8_21_14_all_33_16]PIV62355.1 MAG: hypothetical protein COS12_02710 [Candidatus Roizmanbacteria bacterium CG01_land_8_20_14_3_00_33_9]PIX69560.1 MAG: hypothetical protein COZ39_05260 [Candidatus Roizmanbacteria bacterium CG_4_10_14_3_um_filter_33_21]PJB87868.1 MAG: hypothetical protein CO083_04750 [Candidatus Roizmanbacteria bacterium CG_4_9_14_0_8_um_filter_34_12]PJC30660.1 MAG: hypothetical protei
MITCSCIIPVYNEGKRILKVLDELLKIKLIYEIICVNDGSTDNTQQILETYRSRIKIVSNSKNLGKTGAVNHGIQVSTGNYILLLDGDLRNLKFQEVENTISKMFKDPAIDMIILRRNAPWNIKILRGDILVSGERILRKNDLMNAINELKPKRYQIEFAINKYMYMNNKKVYWMTSSIRNTWPTTKFGFVKGMRKIVLMNLNILSYVGYLNYLKQFLFFCKKRVT